MRTQRSCLSSLLLSLLLLAQQALISKSSFSTSQQQQQQPLHLVFVHTSIPGSCGPLPDYLKASLLQAQRTANSSQSQPHLPGGGGTRAGKVTILGNFKQCRWALHDLQNGGNAELKAILSAESHTIKSPNTLRFEKALRSNVFPKGTANEDALLTGFYRYFMLQDYMIHYNITGHVLHLDADAMLYGDPQVLGGSFRTHFRNAIALSPSIHKRFLSAATMYVGSLGALQRLNAFFLRVVESNSTSSGSSSSSSSSSGGGGEGSSLSQYNAWLRGFACCKPSTQGGLLSDSKGDGVRPWAVNDMTLLAYYRLKHFREVVLFPLLPHGVNETADDGSGSGSGSGSGTSSSKSSGKVGSEVADTHAVALPAPDHPHLPSAALAQYSCGVGGGIVDSWGGWGLHASPPGAGAVSGSIALGGTNSTGSVVGEHSKATDRHAVVEQAVARWGCQVVWLCVPSKQSAECSTKPHVQCPKFPTIQPAPLFTLHLSSKQRDSAAQFASQPCACPSAAK